MNEVKVGGHPEKYWRGSVPFSVKDEAQEPDLWNAISKEFTGQLAMRFVLENGIEHLAENCISTLTKKTTLDTWNLAQRLRF